MKEQLKLTFHPSFHPSLDFNLEIREDAGVLNYRVYDSQNPLMNGPFVSGLDTFTCVVGGEAFIKFVEIIRSINYKDAFQTSKIDGIALDGVKVSVQYISNVTDSGKIAFDWTGGPICKKLFDGFFEFAEEVLLAEHRLMYIKDLKKYYFDALHFSFKAQKEL